MGENTGRLMTRLRKKKCRRKKASMRKETRLMAKKRNMRKTRISTIKGRDQE